MFKQIFALVLVSLFMVNAEAYYDDSLAGRENCEETEVRINEVPLPRSSQTTVNWPNMLKVWISDELAFDLEKIVKQGTKRFISVRMLESGQPIKVGGLAVRADGMRAAGIVTSKSGKANGQKTDDVFLIFRSFKELDGQGRPTARNLFVVTVRTLQQKVKVCQETHYELRDTTGLSY